MLGNFLGMQWCFIVDYEYFLEINIEEVFFF